MTKLPLAGVTFDDANLAVARVLKLERDQALTRLEDLGYAPAAGFRLVVPIVAFRRSQLASTINPTSIFS